MASKEKEDIKQVTKSSDNCPLSLCLYKPDEPPQTSKADKAENPTLINFVYEDDIYGKDGIIEAAGDSVKQEYDKKRLQHEEVSSGVIETASGKLPTPAIFHVMVSTQQGKFEAALRTALRLAYSKELHRVVVPAVECAYPNREYIRGKYPHLPPQDLKYSSGRLVIVPDDNVPSMEHFMELEDPYYWLVFPRSGKAMRATKSWRTYILKEYVGIEEVYFYFPVAVE